MLKQRQQLRIQKQNNRNKISGYVLLIVLCFSFYLVYCIRQHSIEEQQRINPTTTDDLYHEQQIIPQIEDIYTPGHSFDRTNDNLCPGAGKNIDVLIVISTALENFNKRLVLRNTWANHTTLRKYKFSYIFIVGQQDKLTPDEFQRSQNHRYYYYQEPKKIETIVLENYIFSDIVTGRFIDSYDNLTLKTISSFDWSMHNCPLAKYILKCDDDVFVNVENLSKYLNDKLTWKNTLIGHSTADFLMRPHRNKDSKYFITLNEYRPDVFPSFIFGPSYILTSDVIPAIYRESQKQPYLKLEDVFITGIIARILNISIVNNNKFSMIIREDRYALHKMVITVHTKNNFQQYDLWRKSSY